MYCFYVSIIISHYKYLLLLLLLLLLMLVCAIIYVYSPVTSDEGSVYDFSVLCPTTAIANSGQWCECKWSSCNLSATKYKYITLAIVVVATNASQ